MTEEITIKKPQNPSFFSYYFPIRLTPCCQLYPSIRKHILSNTVFPEPFRPIIPYIFPDSNSIHTLSNTKCSLNLTVTSFSLNQLLFSTSLTFLSSFPLLFATIHKVPSPISDYAKEPKCISKIEPPFCRISIIQR